MMRSFVRVLKYQVEFFWSFRAVHQVRPDDVSSALQQHPSDWTVAVEIPAREICNPTIAGYLDRKLADGSWRRFVVHDLVFPAQTTRQVWFWHVSRMVSSSQPMTRNCLFHICFGVARKFRT